MSKSLKERWESSAPYVLSLLFVLSSTASIAAFIKAEKWVSRKVDERVDERLGDFFGKAKPLEYNEVYKADRPGIVIAWLESRTTTTSYVTIAGLVADDESRIDIDRRIESQALIGPTLESMGNLYVIPSQSVDDSEQRGSISSITFPVAKGNYWAVKSIDPNIEHIKVYFIPFAGKTDD